MDTIDAHALIAERQRQPPVAEKASCCWFGSDTGFCNAGISYYTILYYYSIMLLTTTMMRSYCYHIDPMMLHEYMAGWR